MPWASCQGTDHQAPRIQSTTWQGREVPKCSHFQHGRLVLQILQNALFRRGSFTSSECVHKGTRFSMFLVRLLTNHMCKGTWSSKYPTTYLFSYAYGYIALTRNLQILTHVCVCVYIYPAHARTYMYTHHTPVTSLLQCFQG